MLQYFSNGIWKPLPHDNFLINTCNRAKLPIRPVEAQLKEGKSVTIGYFTFREKPNATQNHAFPTTKQTTHLQPESQGNQ